MSPADTDMPVRVLIVDDHPVVRSGLHALLDTATDLEVVAEAGSGEEALALLDLHHVDVVLTDLRMGEGLDGVATTTRVLARPEPPAVLILTTYDHDRDIVRAVEAGAAGYLLKDAAPAAIVQAVRDAARGMTVLAPDLARRMVASMRTPAPTLSDREREVLVLVADGLSNREIARTLFISEATVKTHLVHVFNKLDADSRTAAVAKARTAGLL